MKYTLDVAGDLFEGFAAIPPYPEMKRLDANEEWPDCMTHEDCVAAFTHYLEQEGPVSFYLEDEYDEDGEENEDYDPYLWVTNGVPPVEFYTEISLEDAVDWAEQRGYDEDYRTGCDYQITDEVIQKSVASFRENPFWRDVYDRAPKLARQHLELTFLESDQGDFVAANEEEFEDELERVNQRLGVKDWEYLIETLRGKGGACALAIQQYEQRLAQARTRKTRRKSRRKSSDCAEMKESGSCDPQEENTKANEEQGGK